MKMSRNKKILLIVACVVLIAAIVLCIVLLGNKSGGQGPAAPSQQVSETGATVVGEGQTQFAFTVVDADGKATQFEVHTDKKTVGEALVDAKLIEGEDSEFGLYVKTVNGITVDYDKDKAYWAFYINDEYAMTGVDATDITAGAAYTFKVEKG